MTYVTDTHPFVYHVTGRKQRLGRRARSIFDRSDRGTDTIVVPFFRTGRSPSSNRDRADSYPLATPRFCSVVGQSVNVDLAANDTAVLLEAATFTTIRDPYDRLIIAQARVVGLPLITADEKVQESGLVRTVWD